MARFPIAVIPKLPPVRGLAIFACELLVIGAIYFALKKLDLAVAAIHPGSVPVAPASGFALAATLLRGLHVWPAILAAALVAHAPGSLSLMSMADWILPVSASAAETLEAVVGSYLINAWSRGHRTFESPARALRFAAISLGPSAMLGATITAGVTYLVGAMAPAWSDFIDQWLTQWLRDGSGMLVVTPLLVLWAVDDVPALDRDTATPSKKWMSACALLATGIFGFLAFSPLLELPVNRSALSILAIAPLVWAALRCSQRDSALCALVLSAFAAWGAWPENGPLGQTPEEAFLVATVLIISASALALVLSAEIAQRNLDEAKLRLRERNLRALFGYADIGIAQIDSSGRFKLINSRYGEIFNRPGAELLQLRIQDVLQVKDAAQLVGLLERVIQSREALIFESRIALPNGKEATIKSRIAAIADAGGPARYLVAIAEDVTSYRDTEHDLLRERQSLRETVQERSVALQEARHTLTSEIEERKLVEGALRHDIAERRKTHDALVESEWRFRTVIQGIADYAIFLLDQDGCITEWNVGAQRILQYSADEIIGAHFSRFFSEEEQQSGEPARALQVAAYEGKYGFEGWRVRRDKSKFWASVVIEAIRDENGALAGFVSITHDVSERRRAQVSLERAQEQLSQSHKMEALGQLTGSIAHDFNNLLMIVSGYAQLMRRQISDPKHLKAIDAINAAANRGESLTRQLLAFSRRQPINPVVTDLKERIEAVHEMLVGSLRGNVKLNAEIPADIWPVEVDIAELELALVNMAVNARDAMPGGGVISLSAANVTLAKSDAVDQLEGEFVALSMSDTGVGIAADVLPRIFEPFFTTKALGKGTGLGLSQVYGFSQQSGGTVVATSTVGKGTAITIYLPRKHAALVKRPEASPSPAIVPSEGTILMVEDNPEVAHVSASLLEQLGYQVIRADNAMDALSELQRGSDVTLVFSDIVMPGSMNGVALAQEIGNRYPQLPVLLTSGYSDVAHTAASQFRILRKPFQLAALEKAIREALEQTRARNTKDRVLAFAPRLGRSRRLH
jgi:PAS domain S-box-containing protein